MKIGLLLILLAFAENVPHGATKEITGPDTPEPTCKSVKNESEKQLSLFIPNDSAAEWQSFYGHTIPGVTVGPCGPTGNCPAQTIAGCPLPATAFNTQVTSTCNTTVPTPCKGMCSTHGWVTPANQCPETRKNCNALLADSGSYWSCSPTPNLQPTCVNKSTDCIPIVPSCSGASLYDLHCDNIPDF